MILVLETYVAFLVVPLEPQSRTLGLNVTDTSAVVALLLLDGALFRAGRGLVTG